MIKFLEPAHLPLPILNVPGNHKHWPHIDVSIDNPCHGVDHTWTTDDKTHARSAGQVTVCLGCVACALLVSECNEPDPRGGTCIGYLDDGNPDDAKDNGDMQSAQNLR